MHIGIEAERANARHKTGVEHYAKQLILHLAQIDSHNTYTLYLRSQPEDWFLSLPENFHIKVMPFPKFWTQLRLSWEMLMHPVDLLFIPASALPLIHPRRSVVTLHDTNFMYYPETDTWFIRTYLYWSYWWLAKTAWRAIVISESTKRDVQKFFGMPPQRMRVVYHGFEKANHSFGQLSPAVAAQLPSHYALFLSTIQPRKNLSALIDAFGELKQEHPELPHKLVVVGRPGWKFEPILRKIEENKDTVVYLRHIGDSDRWPVYHRADVFVYPTLYEGFGFPILEAFECEVPVIASRVSSLPEVGGDAVIYFDPTDKQAIKNSLYQVLAHPEQRAAHVTAGRKQLTKFSWDKCARETLAIFEGR